jgi:hypothetical protein
LSGLKAFKKEYPKVPTLVCAPVERRIEIDSGYSAVALGELVQKVLKL